MRGLYVSPANAGLHRALNAATKAFREAHDNNRLGRAPTKGYLMGTIVHPQGVTASGASLSEEKRFEVRYIPFVGLSCPEFKTNLSRGAKWVAACQPDNARWEPAVLPTPPPSKPVFVVLDRKGEYLNPRSGRFDIVFDPFLHLFRDAESAYIRRDSYTGCGNGTLTVRELVFSDISTRGTVPRPTPKTKKDVTP